MGELGDNTLTDHYQPMPVAGLTNVVHVANGHRFSCAMREDASVACWGHGADGQLANGIVAELSPKQVTLPATASVLAVGGHHVCAIVGTSNDVYCWGGDEYGQLGINMPAAAQATPQKVTLATVPTRIGVGYHTTFALDAANKLTGWGENGSHQLGDGSTFDRHLPVAYSGAETFGSVDSGAEVTCGTNGSTLYCWGSDARGELGDGGTLGEVATAHTLPLTGSAISAGNYHVCAINTLGNVYCWGQNYDGACGNGTTQAIAPLGQVSGPLANVNSISAGGDHSCAIAGAGDLYCWGSNFAGQLGVGDQSQHTSPVMVKTGVGRVSAGDTHTCIVAGNAVQCAGDNSYGQLGDGTVIAQSTFKTVAGLPNIVSVGAGVGFTCVLDVTNAVWCWGENSHGEVGIGTTSRRLAPIDVAL